MTDILIRNVEDEVIARIDNEAQSLSLSRSGCRSMAEPHRARSDAHLVDDFSFKDKAPHIAISVDMLDTGRVNRRSAGRGNADRWRGRRAG